MKCFIALFSLFLCLGCSSTPAVEEAPIENSYIYRYSFDNVWRATQIALQNYPVKVNNSDKGLIETEYVKEGQVWTHPTISASTSTRYQLKVKAIKGVVRSKPAIKVIILKKIKKFKNFVEGSEEMLAREHLEQAALLYRIKRELIIDHALSKLQQKE